MAAATAASIPPVLLLVFNRPGPTQRVFDAVRQARPDRLYVASDAARPDRPQEAARVEAVRQMATAVDWPCAVQTLFRDRNLGCRDAVSQAVSWFFEREPEGIVLEDDCVPDPRFFRYCGELLARYRDDERVGWISGTALGDLKREGLLWGDEDYVYTRYPSVWGWASWRRVWREYDVAIAGWAQRRDDVSALTCNRRLRAHNAGLFDAVAAGRIDTWDYQVSHLLWSSSRLAIAPRFNLVENIGFDAEATHTRTAGSMARRAQRGTGELGEPLRAPAQLLPNAAYQRYLEAHATRSRWARLLERMGRRGA